MIYEKVSYENNDSHLFSYHHHLNLLIDGRYLEDFDDGLSLRGSSNQKVIPLSNLYLNNLIDYGVKGRKVEVKIQDNRTKVIGIPSDQVKSILKIK